MKEFIWKKKGESYDDKIKRWVRERSFEIYEHLERGDGFDTDFSSLFEEEVIERFRKDMNYYKIFITSLGSLVIIKFEGEYEKNYEEFDSNDYGNSCYVFKNKDKIIKL